MAERVAEMSLNGFDQAMATKEEELLTAFSGIDEAELSSREVPIVWGGTCSLDQALYGTTLRFLTAY
jgi:hypothetical protein